MYPNTTYQHFLECFEQHPSFPSSSDDVVLVGFTNEYEEFISGLKTAYENRAYPAKLELFKLSHCSSSQLQKAIEACSLYILFYDTDYTSRALKPSYISEIDAFLKEQWQKSCIVKNYGVYFNDAYGTSPKTIKLINEKLMNLAANSKIMTYEDDLGSLLTIDVENAKWTSVDGYGNPDIVPGEIATFGKVNGSVYFTGAFLSTLPFAYNYGLIEEKPLYIEFKDNVIVNYHGISDDFEQQFAEFIKHKPSNRRIEEVGIGTNPTVNKLYSVNAGFEERHVGLHLGLGGGEMGSNHVDLIFAKGQLKFDETIIIKDAKIVYV